MLADVSEALSGTASRWLITFKCDAEGEALEKLWAGLRDLGGLETRSRPAKKGKKSKLEGKWEVELVTSQGEAAVRELFDFVVNVEDLTVQLVTPPAPVKAPEQEAYGFFDDAPGNPLGLENDSGYGFFQSAPGSPLQEVEGSGYGFFEPVVVASGGGRGGAAVWILRACAPGGGSQYRQGGKRKSSSACQCP